MQAPDRSDILNVGGFSDAVFEVVAAFFTAEPSRSVAEIEAIELSRRKPRGWTMSGPGVLCIGESAPSQFGLTATSSCHQFTGWA